jgi:hypothetical protein
MEEQLARAEQLLQEGQRVHAREIVVDILERDNTAIRAWAMLATVANDQAESVYALRQVHALAPNAEWEQWAEERLAELGVSASPTPPGIAPEKSKRSARERSARDYADRQRPGDTEVILKEGREDPLRFSFALKFVLTLGLYYFVWTNNKIVITTRRVIRREGWISKRERSVAIDRIQDITVEYNFWGRIFNYGNLYVETAGGDETEIVFQNVRDPDGLKEAILSQMD